MVFDIPEVLFREILGMSTYPGSPFTGNIFQDIILYFFVPTVFLIIFIYVASGLAVPSTHPRMRMLMAIAIFAFIIASRYYEGFAIFASQFYFIFIIIIGIVYFFGRHFRRPGGGAPAMAYAGSDYHGGGGGGDSTAWARKREIDEQIVVLESRYSTAKSSPGGSHAAGEIEKELRRLEQERRELDKRLKPWKKYW